MTSRTRHHGHAVWTIFLLPLIGLAQAQQTDWKRRIEAVIAPINAELRTQRVAYHRYLVESGRGQGETLEQHIERYANFATIAVPATDAELQELVAISPVALPDELAHFYRSAGGFYGGPHFAGTKLPSPGDLVRMHRTQRPYERIGSIGLIDMIRVSWGNDRPEFEAESAEALNQDQIDALNGQYAVIGWRQQDEGEAFDYLYVDATGRFDLLHYHQDDFETLYEDELMPMIAGRGASLSFAEAFGRWLVAP